MVLDRQYTYERLALAIQRGDDDFRLLVDRSLSKAFESAGYRGTYAKWFGEPNERVRSLLPVEFAAGVSQTWWRR